MTETPVGTTVEPAEVRGIRAARMAVDDVSAGVAVVGDGSGLGLGHR